jgi:hypothetical protein
MENQIQLRALTHEELMAPVSLNELIAEKLELAAKWIREGKRYESACWRLADAGAEFRSLLEGDGVTDVVGLDSPTGMGAQLPRSPKLDNHEKVQLALAEREAEEKREADGELEYFHTFKGGRINYQGHVVSRNDTHVKVQLYSWLTGYKTDRLTFPLAEVAKWKFYPNHAEWLAAAEIDQAKKR